MNIDFKLYVLALFRKLSLIVFLSFTSFPAFANIVAAESPESPAPKMWKGVLPIHTTEEVLNFNNWVISAVFKSLSTMGVTCRT